MSIYVCRATGGETRRLTLDSGASSTPHFSRDGRWVYYTSTRSGSYQIWKSPFHAAGSKDEAIQVTKNGGYLPREDPEGRYLYYLRPGKRDPYAPALWRQPTDGGDENAVLEPVMHYTSYAVTRTGLYYVRQQHWGAALFVSFYNFSTGASNDVCRFGQSDYYPSLAVSPDGKWLLFARQNNKHSVMLVKDPR
jgi:Tol biopolymer transport system component